MRLRPMFVLIASLLTLTAHAQDAENGRDALATEEARAAFEAGRSAYEAGRFPQALEYFERAYELTEEPDILYNIATVHDRLRHDEDALEAYRAYLAARPETSDRPNIEARISALEEAVARARPEPAPVELEPAASPAPAVDPGPPTGALALVGVGAGLAAVGGGLLIWALADTVTVESADGVTWPQIEDAYDRVPIVSGVGYAAAGVGVALLVGGLAWLAVGAGDEAEVALGPGGLTLRGRI